MLSLVLFLFNFLHSPELIIGEEKIPPGIIVIFEGAVKDKIHPSSLHLPESQTDVHIEARVNWDSEKIPKGAVPNGFIPYLKISALIINSKTGFKTFIDLKPHINLIDNFHYARNIALPGKISDDYSVEFNVTGPTLKELALHKDWYENYGSNFMEIKKFFYNKVNFEEIAKASR